MMNGFILLGLLLLIFSCGCDSSTSNESQFEEKYMSENGSAKEQHLRVISIHYDHVQSPLLITIILLLICAVKLIFEHCHMLNQLVPESCVLLVLGIGVGFLLVETNAQSQLAAFCFSPEIFFLFLLPPIILEAAYSLKDREFLNNIGPILLFAVVGTILNVAIIGPSLFGFYKTGVMGSGFHVSLMECLLFASIVAATDPVAVLAIFQTMGVYKTLYFLVFGESLLNDAVSVALYNTFVEFLKMDSIGARDCGLGVARFFCACVGATSIGLFTGFACAFATKYTKKITSAEPFVIFGFAYLSYLLAETFQFSGIISLVCCGLIQAHYAMENISLDSRNSVQQFSKTMSSLSEDFVFFVLSVMAVNVRDAWHHINVAFLAFAVLTCVVSRFIATYGLAFCANRFLSRKIGNREQFIIAYGGLRGPITFSLAFSLDAKLLGQKETTQHVMLTSAYAVIFFTTFFQGITMKPIVKLLGIRLDQGNPSLFEEINQSTTENISTAIEAISGSLCSHTLSAMSQNFSRRFLRPFVNRDPHKKWSSLITAYQNAKKSDVDQRQQITILDVATSNGAHREKSQESATRIAMVRMRISTAYGGLQILQGMKTKLTVDQSKPVMKNLQGFDM